MLKYLEDVFRCLERHRVKYLVLGGIAAVLHGVPRATFDLELLIAAEPGNVSNLLAALKEAGFGTSDLTTVDEVLSNEITIFNDRVRVDVLTSAPGVGFEDAWKRRETMKYSKQSFQVISKEDLIAAKGAAGRPVDLEDAASLEGQDPREGED